MIKSHGITCTRHSILNRAVMCLTLLAMHLLIDALSSLMPENCAFVHLTWMN
ncbi:hypothetical protein BC940DRAFT_364903 [Gongronella butleri]|nr:hypothetical protein BC940DRAFT_364903 [Gongronella butleri]